MLQVLSLHLFSQVIILVDFDDGDENVDDGGDGGDDGDDGDDDMLKLTKTIAMPLPYLDFLLSENGFVPAAVGELAM